MRKDRRSNAAAGPLKASQASSSRPSKSSSAVPPNTSLKDTADLSKADRRLLRQMSKDVAAIVEIGALARQALVAQHREMYSCELDTTYEETLDVVLDTLFM